MNHELVKSWKMIQLKTQHKILILIWIVHLFIFIDNKNYFPLLTYDLFARIKNFQNSKEVFLAKTENRVNFDTDISSEISFDYYWKFIVTIRRMMRENPEHLRIAIQRRITELNIHRQNQILGVQFVEVRGGEQKILFEIAHD